MSEPRFGMRSCVLSLLVLALFAAPVVLAEDDPADYTVALVPLVTYGLPGAHGSIWNSELHILNKSPLPLRMLGAEQTGVAPIDLSVRVDPRETRRVALYPLDHSDGSFLYIPNAMVNTTKMSLRVRDTSQNATSLGDDVPVVRLDQGVDNLTIFDVPVDPKYRATLRVYGFTPAPMVVGVTISSERNTLLADFDLDLQGTAIAVVEPFPSFPAYAAVNPLTDAVRAAAAGARVRIEITNYAGCCTPPLPVPKFWAFVSLTNNETNQVTIVTPK